MKKEKNKLPRFAEFGTASRSVLRSSGGAGVVPRPLKLSDKEISLWKKVALFQFIYSVFGLVIGLLTTIMGLILSLRGVGGASSWTAKFIGLESNISDAAPGVVLFLVGLSVVFITRFEFKAKKNYRVSR